MLTIERADFADQSVTAFLKDHLLDMEPTAPEESRHALDLAALQRPGVRLWVAYENREVVGTVALAELDENHEELKSMRTAPHHRGKGIASQLLEFSLQDARSRGVSRVSLETGSMEFFAAARALYRRSGFIESGPFGSYEEDPNSVFMTMVF
ncbi:GNAT family N-acetyltransferase [Brevibacterium sp. R8603A2]|uniref:GNAT family N-acetyltransferase n=1 Tax=Brevibacterium sp. R8603A2 TaxID=2929779 RepID=UPI001FFBE0DC|nr:GNAT family N-acetyltransferase [Brevibacterium sp. R8603A2]MCK1804253.1 GNAT family N-acetyltransferase [Brevibacterium sp. R8603A2]